MKIIGQTISLNGLRFYAYHGAEVQEAVTGAWYRVNVDICADVRSSMDSDSLNDTVNYARVASVIKQQMEIPSKLIEHVAGRIASELERCFGERIQSMTVTVIKENPPVGAVCDESSFTLSLRR
ncbi:MAG: dihydroneopterin aldolase [Bacteroidaceae bacterium]|nr:dihydroneopterin aldolase [Bacteroidaceae bacterium]